MKIDEILLVEYDRARAAQAVGPNLWKATLRNMLDYRMLPLGNFEKNFEEKYPAAYRTYGYIFTDPTAQNNLANDALERLEKADPTTNKKYTQWLARMFASDPFTKMEDIRSTGAEYLYKFNILSSKKLLKPEHGDINRFKNLKTFMDVLDQYELPEDDQAKGKAEKLYSDNTVTVVHPEDEAAACAYGRQTRWCTAATRGVNYFDHYDRQGPLYILIPKSPEIDGEKYQLHFPSGQFMNEDDEQVPLVPLITERFPGLLEFFKSREPKALNDLIELAPDDVLKPILDKIADIMSDVENDIITQWEIHDDYYYAFLQKEGFVNDDGDIADDAPSYFDYNDEAARTYSDMVDAIHLSPRELKNLTRDYKEQEPDNPGTIDNIEHVMIMNFINTLDEGISEKLRSYMERRVHIGKDKEGNWDVKRISNK